MTDYDDILDGDRRQVEERFRELEYDAEIERIRREQGAAPGAAASRGEGRGGAAAAGDPLADMKAALDGDEGSSPDEAAGAAVERYVLALCPHCDAKNRVSLTKLRTGNPTCGACKEPLSFTR